MTLEDILTNQASRIIIVILVAVLANSLGRTAISKVVRRAVRSDRYEHKVDERKREDTIINFFRAGLMLIIVIATIFSILVILNVNIAALATGAGVFGLVFSISAQSLVKSYVAGISILAENQYRVGDVIGFSGGVVGSPGTSGVVEEITLRSTKIRDMEGNVHTIANGDAGIITNMTFKYANVLVDVTVGHDTDIEKVKRVIDETGKGMLDDVEWAKQIIDPVAFLRVENFTELGVTVRMYGKVRPASQWDVGGEFRRRLKEAFDKNHISLAVPQRIIHAENESKASRTSKK